MNNKSSLVARVLTVLVAVLLVPNIFVYTRDMLYISLQNKPLEQTASTFFVDSKNQNELVTRYKNGGKVNILIVPGHDDEYSGTEFRGLREADANLFIAKNIYSFLATDNKLNVRLSRDENGYAPGIKDYFTNRVEYVRGFMLSQMSQMKNLLNTGKVAEKTDGVYHNNAKTDVALRLYATNKWANDNNIDIIINVHINDHAGRRSGVVGDYNGFTIYVPDKQFSNARASKPLANILAQKLKTVIPESDLPREGDVVEDQALIAIGASNTLDPVSLLIEYGYIYEPQYENKDAREAISKEYGNLTAQAVKDYLSSKNTITDSVLLQNKLDESLGRGDVGADTAVLQKALAVAGTFPIETRECYITGTFGPCTEKALKEFQKQNGLEQTGELGPKTREKLNALIK